MLPEALIKKPEYTQLTSLLQTRDQLVKLRVSLINKIHSLFNSNGIKIKKEVLTSKEGFERVTQEHTWLSLEQIEIDIIAELLEAIRKSLKKLEKEITSFAQNLSGYKNLISIKGMGYIKKKGYRTWYHKSYYGCRNKVENTFYRLKNIFGRKLNSRNWNNQQAEAHLICCLLNKVTKAGMPKSVKIA